MKSLVMIILGALCIMPIKFALASPYGAKLCKEDPKYKCLQVGGKGWRELRNNERIHNLLKRVNRVNVGLWGTIAVPKNIHKVTLTDLSPFPKRMPAPMEKLLMVDLDHLAWGAYGPDGILIKWGPIAPGKSWCADVASSCHTITGKFAIYRKGGAGCKSGKFPRPNGGAPMPYCSFFHGGFAIHAGKLPGRPDSHGCVRTYREDAAWLSQKFLDMGTKVHVRPFDKL